MTLKKRNETKQKHPYAITDYATAHDWVKDNEYIHTGHRVHFYTFKDTVKSLFMTHNETMNIWVHLLGVLFFLLLLTFLITNYSRSAELFKDIRKEFSNTSIVQKFSKLSNDLLHLVSSEPDAVSKRLDEIIQHLEHFKAKPEAYFKELKQLLVQQEIDFVHSFDEKIQKISGKFGRMVDRFKEGLKNSQFNMQNIETFIKNCFSEENFQKTVFYSFHGHLEYYPIIVFIFGAIACLGFSTLFHWFHIMNPRMYKILHKLDYAGISFLNFGSSFACFFYYFYCNVILFRIFAGAIFIACFVVFVVSMTDYMDRPENTTKKGLMYGGLGISNVLPSIAIAYLMCLSHEDSHYLPLEKSFFGLILMAALYLVGLWFYISKFPEKYYPGKFDIIFHSHSIWHIFVFLAAAQHMLNVIWLYNLRTEYPCRYCTIH